MISAYDPFGGGFDETGALLAVVVPLLVAGLDPVGAAGRGRGLGVAAVEIGLDEVVLRGG